MEAHGFILLEKNFRTPKGEIDLILGREENIRFVEVKAYRTLNADVMEQVLGPRKRNRLIQAGLGFLAKHPKFLNYSIQFDLVFIDKSINDVIWYEDVIQHEN